ncbi:hypothetical protein [Bradyrhizobium genosp. P]|uniref:hypothetical protein n=1 Tax=Bradyrhizobium genosp. P TaxID=83641 RepID=UPI003CFA9B6C
MLAGVLAVLAISRRLAMIFRLWIGIDLSEPRRHACKRADRAGITQLLNPDRGSTVPAAGPPIQPVTAPLLIDNLPREALKGNDRRHRELSAAAKCYANRSTQQGYSGNPHQNCAGHRTEANRSPIWQRAFAGQRRLVTQQDPTQVPRIHVRSPAAHHPAAGDRRLPSGLIVRDEPS